MKNQENGKLLCQNISRNFNKSLKGKILEDTVKEVYSLMLLNLNLNETSKKWYSKGHSFTFSVDAGLLVLQDLSYSMETPNSTICFKYKINETIGVSLLTKFYEAKLLHCPQDRTRNKLKNGCLLQPTPKGVTILKQFIEDHGLKFNKIPQILNSSLNSMDLFNFERNYLTDKIIYSENLVKILFNKMFGKTPNIWSPNNKPELFKINLNNSYYLNDNENLFMNQDCYVTSPLFHRFFTNPESDAHVQYYLSSGIRVLHNQAIGDTKFHYIVTGKALTQWLMDCTDILSMNQAIKIGNMFLKLKLLTSNPPDPDFKPTNSFYTITPYGKTKISWYKQKNRRSQRNYDLTQYLQDPGLKYLLTLHSIGEFYNENIIAYNLLKLFQHKTKLLNKFVDYISSDTVFQYQDQLTKLSSDCLSSAYHIYFTCILEEASLVVNIDYGLRQRITSLLIDNNRMESTYDGNLTTPLALDLGLVQGDSSGGSESWVDGRGSSLTMTTETDKSEETKEDEIKSEVKGEESLYEPKEVGALDEPKEVGALYEPKEVDKQSTFSSIFSNFHTQTVEIDEPEDPTEFNKVYELILSFIPLSNELMNEIVKLLRKDSFPKFLTSELFKDYQHIFET